MLRRLGAAIYRGLFWTYERGTWQYDVMVALILAFIFLTPRAWFHDQPLSPRGSDVVLLVSNTHEKVYQLPAILIDASADKSLQKEAARILQLHTGKPVDIIRIEPDVDSQGQVVSYAVWVQE